MNNLIWQAPFYHRKFWSLYLTGGLKLFFCGVIKYLMKSENGIAPCTHFIPQSNIIIISIIRIALHHLRTNPYLERGVRTEPGVLCEQWILIQRNCTLKHSNICLFDNRIPVFFCTPLVILEEFSLEMVA